MQHRLLGKTGLNVSVIGFGALPIQRVDEKTAVEVMHKAFDLGMNFLDTGHRYTDSESKVGAALKGRRNGIIVASKSPARDKKGMLEHIQLSLKQMGLDYIDLYQLHNVKSMTDMDKVLAPGGALEALQDAKQEGLIRHIGISSHRKETLFFALREGFTETIQVPFNAVETDEIEQLLDLAEQTDTGVIVMKPLAGGAFGNAPAALKYLLTHRVSTVIPGMDSVEQVVENARVGTEKPLLTEEEQKSLTADIKRLGKEFCRRCEYCLPCPLGINIPQIFIWEAYFDRYNLIDFAQSRYQNLKIKADNCIKCGKCENKCPYDLPIRNMLARADQKLSLK
ncbi:MAG: aldo/keto reductase [Peptococcaceae bacterium]